MFKAIIFAALMVAGTSHAQDLEQQAENAAIGDTVTTLGAIALGASEANPLGIAVLGLKPPLLAYIATLPDDEQPWAYAVQGSIWSAATANNVCVIASILTGGAFGAACLVAGIGWGMKTWTASAEEREFWDMCREHRAHANNPQMTCNYTQRKEI